MNLARFTPLALAVLVTVSGCSSKKSVEDELTPPETIYAEAEQMLQEDRRRAAAERFKEVERLHPYSPYAKRAMLMAAYAHFEAAQYDQAVAAARRYIEYYPSDADTDYARYLIGESYFERISDVSRDQGATLDALRAYRELVQKHPESQYASDAMIKIDLCIDQLAGKEMDVGRYYLSRGQCQSAIPRFRTVIEQYQRSAHIEEALHRSVECFLMLGQVGEAQSVAAVLGHNFPNSEWYGDSYEMLANNGQRPSDRPDGWAARALRALRGGVL